MTPHGTPRLPDSRDFLLLVTTGRRFASFPGLTGDHEASGVDRFVHGGKLAGAFGIEDNAGRMRQLGLST
jgi:hypothetical protein